MHICLLRQLAQAAIN